MRRLFIALMLLYSTAFASGGSFNFANCVWGASPEETKRALGAAGFTEFEIDDDGDYQFGVLSCLVTRPGASRCSTRTGDL